MVYKDISSSRWSYKSIETVTKAGLMSGYPDGTFQPEKSLTREEMASILHRLLFRDGLFNDTLPQVVPSVVLVHRGDALGSGACIHSTDNASYIITNAHVVGDKAEFTLIKDDGTPNFTGTLIAKDAELDLAIIKATRVLPPLAFSGKDPDPGEPVAAIGSPLGLTESVAVGIISSTKRDKYLQIDVPVNPGNSGGPLINERGEIVGVVTSKIVDIAVEGIAFAIKAGIAKQYISRVL